MLGAPLATAGVFLGYVSQLEAGEVGPMAAYMPPAPVSDCDACNDPGFYGGVSLLYMKPYSGGEGLDGEWDLGLRGTLGFERPDGLFYELNGFWFDGEFDREVSPNSIYNYDDDVSTWYVEGLIGDNLHCGEACLDLAFGLRYANLEFESSRTLRRDITDGGEGSSFSEEFEGVGPVVRIDGTRQLTEQVTLYGGLSQAILFGEQDFSRSSTNRAEVTSPPGPGAIILNGSGSSSRDTLAFVTEIEAGLQFNFNAGQIQGAHARIGIEGQYWSIGGSDFGLFGGVLGVGFNF
ncbi:MAG: hypothetical protein HKO57_14170 [Akkermansiaceae bacterium]|nr:hypothetical protein [Akkermansiaceae bacterium]